MKKYITFIIAAVFVLGANPARADHHSKTNKVAQAKSKTTPNKASAEARKKYAAAVKKIREAVKAGKTVVHYTLELADTTIGSRYDSCITGVPLSDLFSFKEMIYDTLQEIEGSLIVKEYPTKTASSQTIRNHLDKLKQRDIKPDMIIVDYGDLLKATTVYKEKRMNL